jgi:hypothetical protein
MESHFSPSNKNSGGSFPSRSILDPQIFPLKFCLETVTSNTPQRLPSEEAFPEVQSPCSFS